MTAQPGLVFGTDPAHYDEHRPAVPREVADWLVPPGIQHAVDVGAGTGHFTRALLERANRVVAVDPDPQMCAWLRDQYPDAIVHEGSSEHLPVESGSADGVFSSNAWHWFDPPAAAAEAARCLRPGGVLGVSWHDRGPSDLWLAEVQEKILTAHRPDRRIHDLTFPSGLPFSPVKKHVITYERAMTAQEICAMHSTYSAIISLSADDRDELLGRLFDHLVAKDGRDLTFAVPFIATCYRTVRLD